MSRSITSSDVIPLQAFEIDIICNLLASKLAAKLAGSWAAEGSCKAVEQQQQMIITKVVVSSCLGNDPGDSKTAAHEAIEYLILA
jgi:hypothetical protein